MEYNTMMMFVLSVLLIFALLVLSEVWWRRSNPHDELSRKFVHITVGTFVAFWPFFLSWNQIKILSVAFLLGVAASKYLKIFTAIHSVQRPTWGELFFAAAVGVIALVTENKWIYAAALLQMSLADGLAAVIGVQFGKKQRYMILGQPKSLQGTATFFVVSLAILVFYVHGAHVSLGVPVMVAIAAAAAAFENLGVMGLDNLVVPLLVAVLLHIA